MRFWRFFDYITEGHSNPIQDWYGTVDHDVQAAFDVLVQELAGTEVWNTPNQYRLLTGKHLGMCELVFKVGRRKFRALGMMEGGKREFVLLGGCEHTRWYSIPSDAFDAAYKLKTQLDEERGATREHV